MPDYSEWIGEDISPGGMGAVTIRFGLPDRRSLAPTLTYGLVAAALLATGIYFAITQQAWVRPSIVLAIIGVYLLIGYMIRPEADRSNLGWFGGVMDNPFRYSDDINRWLLWLMLVLWPGRFVTEGLISAVAYPFRSAVDEANAQSNDLGPELLK